MTLEERYYKQAIKNDPSTQDILYVGLFVLSDQAKVLDGLKYTGPEYWNVVTETGERRKDFATGADFWAQQFPPGFLRFLDFLWEFYQEFKREEIASLPMGFWENLPVLKDFDHLVYLIREELKPKKHKQPRSYLKTMASLVSRDRDKLTQFDMSHYYDSLQPMKEKISKKTAAIGNALLSLWQQNKDENHIYHITNLSETARLLQTTPQELKLYLIYLGGYNYPVIQLDQEKRILSWYQDRLFHVRFNMRLLPEDNIESIGKDMRVGTKWASFLRNRDVLSVVLQPSENLMAEFDGKGLGNILVDDYFLALCLGLSDIGYKLLSFIKANSFHKISFKKLISSNHLNLSIQLKKQGKKRILESIKKGFEELKKNGEIESYRYGPQKDMFYWEGKDRQV